MKKIITATILGLTFLFIGLSSAQAATLTVTKIVDTDDNVCDADCSLREAIFAAVSGDTIEFASPLFDSPQTIMLSIGSLGNVAKTLTITGKGTDLTTISGNGATMRVFFNNGDLTLNNLIVKGGRLTYAADGAGIYNDGTLTINNCLITDNKNINNPNQTDYVNRKLGGGIFNNAGRTVRINNSFISENSVARAHQAAGGGLYNAGTAVISGSTFLGNTTSDTNTGGGGAIYNSGFLIVQYSTLTGNAANGGGGATTGGALYTRSYAALTNMTISGNSVGVAGAVQGGGVFSDNSGTLEVTNTTVTNNNGQGIYAFSGTTRLINSIVSGNNGTNVQGSLAVNTNNFINGDAQLAPLAHNGGSTLTHLPLSTSPVINAGSNCVVAANGCLGYALTTDQRGTGFPRLQGPTVDIGAVESSRGIVTNANGSGAGSLRQAITDAPAGDTIYFDAAFFAVPRTIIGNFSSDKNLTILGPGANLLTLDADNFGRVFTTGNGATVNVSGIRFTRGRAFAPDSAGGILIHQNSTLNATGIIVDNSTAFAGGGGIYVDGTLNLTDSTVENNTANNSAGISVVSGRTATLTRSIVRSNTATNNSGGIGNNGTLNFYSSTLSGNTAPFGGGLSNGGFANFANSTISGNRASGKGGGIYNNGGTTVHLLNSTVTNNQSDGFAGAGIWNENFSNPSTTVRARNTIIAANISGNGNPRDYVGGITDLGNNIINNANPGLAPLGNYGGATPTHALLPDSPALNAGSDCVLTANGCSSLTHSAYANDQRGTNTPRKIGTSVDIGAFESNITFNQNNLPNANTSANYNQQLSANRQTNFAELQNLAPTVFEVVAVAGQSLPPGITLSSGGFLSGMPTNFGTFTFTVKATDTDGMAGVRQFSMYVFSPTSADISIAGSVKTANGNGIRNAVITLTDMNGNVRKAQTGSFGFYKFENVEAGQTYIISVSAKRFTFAQSSQVISVQENAADVDFIAQE